MEKSNFLLGNQFSDTGESNFHLGEELFSFGKMYPKHMDNFY